MEHWISNINNNCEIEELVSPRRPALLIIREFKEEEDDLELLRFPNLWEPVDQVPVLVWPNPTIFNGGFIVEHKNGKCEIVPPYNLVFLDSEKEFSRYNWDK